MNQKLTIVIPFFKLKHFDECLGSLARQKSKDFKVIISNDASSENPSEIIEKYKGLNLKYVEFNNNLGQKSLVKHWIRSVELVETDFFMILGDDDMLSDNTINSFYNLDNKDKFNVFRLDVQLIDEKSYTTLGIIRYDDNQSPIDFFFKKFNNEVRNSLGEFIFRTDSFKKYGIKEFPKAFYSDNWMIMIYSNFKKIKNVEYSTSYIRVFEGSLSGNQSNKLLVTKAGWLYYKYFLIRYFKIFSTEQRCKIIKYLIKRSPILFLNNNIIYRFLK